jgi:hypothetical protein
MRGVYALMICLLAGLALSGRMQMTAPMAQPRSGLDTMAYGGPCYSTPAAALPSRSAVADFGGAITAFRASFAASPRSAHVPASAAYAAAPMPVAHDTAYGLDGGDRRVVAYAQESLTNTLPLIGVEIGDRVTPTHTDKAGLNRAEVPLGAPLSHGDTVLVGERWL